MTKKIWTEITDLSSIKVGERIRAKQSGTTIIGAVVEISVDSTGTLGFSIELTTVNLVIGTTHWKIEAKRKPTPVEPVPTRDGHYLDKDGDHWELTNEERTPEEISSGYHQALLPDYAPYTRLEPVDETVGAVVARVGAVIRLSAANDHNGSETRAAVSALNKALSEEYGL